MKQASINKIFPAAAKHLNNQNSINLLQLNGNSGKKKEETTPVADTLSLHSAGSASNHVTNETKNTIGAVAKRRGEKKETATTSGRKKSMTP